MPYVERSVRKVLLEDNTPEDVGELNYLITKLCDNFLRTKGRRYANINAVIGALECAKQEFYRRIASVYEDEKLQENGDVYSAANLSSL
jgi:hypothetical protein